MTDSPLTVAPLTGSWEMVVIGIGPGPKNVLARRVEDGLMTVVPYSRWKRELTKVPKGVHSDDHEATHGRCAVDLQVQVMQVAVRNTNSGRQIFDVACSDGKTRAVWDAGLANAINAFANSGATITVRVKVSQNGQYTNETITAFAPPGQALPPEGAGAGPGGPRGGGGGGRGMSDEDKTRIAKMGAQGSAATLVAALFQGAGPEAYEEAVGMLDTLTRKLYVDARSHEKPASQQGGTVLQPGAQVGEQAQGAQVLPQATTPQQVAAQVPGVQVGAPVAGSPLPQGGAADAQAAQDVQAQAASEQGDKIDWD